MVQVDPDFQLQCQIIEVVKEQPLLYIKLIYVELKNLSTGE